MNEQITASPADQLKKYVTDRVLMYQEAYGKDEAFAVADLAKLRRGLRKNPGVDMEATGLAIGHLYDGKPDGFLVPDGASDAEQAAYSALTLFAMHLQSRRGQKVHQPRYSFGRSVRKLSGPADEQNKGVRRRFEATGTAQSWDELVFHASGLIQMFRSNDVPLDYGQFAQDLYWLRKPGSEASVRRRWAADFYRVASEDDELKPKPDVADADQ